jgi:hypothetical protein
MKRLLLIVVAVFSINAHASDQVARRLCPEFDKGMEVVWDQSRRGVSTEAMKSAMSRDYHNETEAGINFLKFVFLGIDLAAGSDPDVNALGMSRQAYLEYMSGSCVIIATNGQFGNE